MKKFLSLALAIVMVLSLTVIAASAASTATVSLYGIDGSLIETKTYEVGDVIEVVVCLNTSNLGTIGSVKADQGYTSDVLKLTESYDLNTGLIKNTDSMFPITKGKTTANGKLDGRVSYNASTPEMDPDGFAFNSDDSALIVSHYTVIAAGTASITNSITTLAVADYWLTRVVDKGEIKNSDFTMNYSMSDPAPVEGYTVSGTVTSFVTTEGSENYPVTVQLVKGDVAIYETTTTGLTANYSFSDVGAGDYILRVSKQNHVTRDYEITVAGAVEQNAKICPLGDVTQDGKLTTMDFTKANSHARGVNIMSGYELKCGDVVKGDGLITTLDATRINSHVKGVNSMFT